MNNYFKNKVVAITGGTEGIGKALAEQLLQHGSMVATCGRSEEKLQRMKEQHTGENFFCLAADVSKLEDCEQFIHATIETFGRIDILINNAGMSMRAELKHAEIDVFRKLMDINYFGTLYCTKLALTTILAQKGDIVGISSIAGFRGLPGRSGYSASKFAVNGLLEAIRTELIEDEVNVLCVCPGFTQTNIRNAALNASAESHGESPLDEKSLMSAEECATHILKAIAGRKRLLVLTFTGKRTVFMNKFFPAWTDKLTRKFFYNKKELVK